MIRSKEKYQTKLTEIYGFKFPDALFWLHEFIIEQRDCDDPIDLGDLSLYPSGPLELLLNFDLELVKFSGNPLLHYRYYRDVPEFFTYLIGDSDGQHWGMLIDEPAYGFRGAAMYWNNDGAEMTTYNSLFDPLIEKCEDTIDVRTEYLDDEGIAYYNKLIELAQKLKSRIKNFLEINQLTFKEWRPIGLQTSTGLDLVSDNNFESDSQAAIEMLTLGRELWYWTGREDRSTEAFELMKKAYELLGRHELILVLDAHFHNRNLPNLSLVH
jgi:hypothetical protein